MPFDLNEWDAADQASGAGPAAAVPSYPVVEPHLAPGSTTEWTNLSDDDYRKFNAGIPPPAAMPFEHTDSGKEWAAADAASKQPASAQGPTKKTGLVANIGAGTSEGVAQALGMPVDLATGVLNLPSRAINAVAGTHLPVIEHPVGGSEWMKSAEGLIGADPRDVGPAGAGEQMARAAARGATAIALPGGVARALPEAASALGAVQHGFAGGAGAAGAAVGAGSGIGGQVASDLVPEKYKPLADFVGQLAGGVATGGGMAAGTGLARGLGSVKQSVIDPIGIGPKVTITDPTNPDASVTGTRGQIAAAGRTMAQGMGQTPADAAASIPADTALVPGSTPTVGQATGNVGALALERRLQNTNRVPFTEADAANNTARVAALQGLAPGEAGTAASEYFRGIFSRAQAEDEAELAGKRADAQAAVQQLGGDPSITSAQALGAERRAGLEAIRTPAKAEASRALDLVDPDRKLVMGGLSGVGDAAGILRGDRAPHNGWTLSDDAVHRLSDIAADGEADLAPAERAILDRASEWADAETFQAVRRMLRRVSAAQRAIGRNPEFGRESLPYARMTALRGALEDAMSATAAKVADGDAQAIASGVMAPEQSMLARFHREDANASQTMGTATEGTGGGVAGVDTGTGADGKAPDRGESVQDQGRPGGPDSNRGVATGAADVAPLRGRNRAPDTLHDFIISKGGIRDVGGEMRALDLDRIHHRAGGRLVNPKGMDADGMRMLARDDGFPVGDTVRSFLDAVTAREPVYRPEDTYTAQARRQADREAFHESEARYNARDAVGQSVDAAGVRASSAEIDHATDLVMQGAHPDEALRQAIRGTDEQVLQRNAVRNGVGSPGMPLAEQPDLAVERTSRLTPNMDAAAVDALRTANAKYALYKNAFRSGSVGDVLASGSGPGGFRIGAADVPARLFRGGPKGAEAADSLIKATGSVEAAEGLLGDYPAFSLRKAAAPDDVFDLKKYQRWMDTHSAVLDKFPALKKRFESAAAAQAEVEAAAARHVERVNQIQDSAARFYLTKDGGPVDVQVAVNRLMTSQNPAQEAAALMRAASGSRAAVDGIQRNVADWLIAKAKSTAEAGTTGEKEIAGGVYQKLIADPKIDRALSEVFDSEQMKMVRAIGKDIERAARSVNSVKIKGSPGTAADLHAMGGHGGSMSMLIQMALAEQAMEAVGHLSQASGLTEAALGFGGAVGGVVLAAARRAGAEHVDQIAAQAMLHPELGRILLQRAVTDPKAPIMGAFSRRMTAVMLGGHPD